MPTLPSAKPCTGKKSSDCSINTLGSAAMISLEQKLKCAERELALRRSVYPKRVRDGRMKQAHADHEIACMEAVVDDYRQGRVADANDGSRRVGQRD
jgi:hypothetical protein